RRAGEPKRTSRRSCRTRRSPRRTPPSPARSRSCGSGGGAEGEAGAAEEVVLSRELMTVPFPNRAPRDARDIAEREDRTGEDLDGKGPMKTKAYEAELHHLQAELCHLQAWVKATGQRIVIVFEGRDAAGKGGTIKAITERVSPRVFRVVALPAPSD